MLPEFIVWFVIFCVVWGVSIGISFYTRHNTNFKGLFNKRADSMIGGVYFAFGPICALAAITMGLIHFVKHRSLHAKIFKLFRILTSEGRHQIALEKEHRQRELEEEERKRLEAQNETISSLLIESELDTAGNLEEAADHEKQLATEINERFEDAVGREVDEVVGPLLDAKIAEIFRESEIDNIENLKDLDDFVEDAADGLKTEMKSELKEIVELQQAIEDRVEFTNQVSANQFVKASRQGNVTRTERENHVRKMAEMDRRKTEI